MAFKRSVFNVYGNSPLVQYYMRVLHMDPKVGQDVLVVRTEISKLPPYPHNDNNGVCVRVYCTYVGVCVNV